MRRQAAAAVLCVTLLAPTLAFGVGPAEGDRVEAVQERAWQKRGAFALAPLAATGLNDPFLLRGGVGLRGTWWPRSLVGLSLEAAGWGQTATASAEVAQRELRARLRPTGSGWMALGQVEVSAVDGKIAGFGSILPFELALRGGLGAVSSREASFAQPSFAISGGVLARWFSTGSTAIETGLALRSASVERRINGRVSSFRDTVVSFEVAVPFRFGGGAESKVQAAPVASGLFPGVIGDRPGSGTETAAAVTASADPYLEAAASLPYGSSAGQGSVPLSEPIAPVPRRDHGWAFSVSTALGLADPFWSKVTTTADVRYGFGRIAANAFGGRAFSWASPALDVCSGANTCTRPDEARLKATPGRLDWIGGAGGVLRAADGKLSVGGLEAAHFRLEAGVAATIVGYEVQDGSDPSRWGPGARLGLSAGVDTMKGVSVGVDLQSVLYAASVRGVTGVERQLLLGVSVGFRPRGGP